MKALFRFVILVASSLTTFAASSRPVPNVEPVSAELIRRLLQYEVLLSTELNLKTSLCVDATMGHFWVLGTDESSETRQSSTEKLRHTAERCTVNDSSVEGRRLAAQLRAMTERQLKLAKRLDKPMASVRGCLTKSGTATEFTSCLATTLDKTPSEAELMQWLQLYEHRISFQ